MQKSQRKTKVAALVTTLILLLGAFTVSFMMSAKEPRAVLIYTQNEWVPDIIFKVSSIPLALASYAKFGSSKFAAQPATTENIEAAFAKAEFLVIGTHGWNGMIYSDNKIGIGPFDIPNPNMRSVYFGSCYFGAKRRDWERMFPNAKVIGYDKITDQFTGWRYLVFKSWIDLFRDGELKKTKASAEAAAASVSCDSCRPYLLENTAESPSR